jgi:hypothetical protein
MGVPADGVLRTIFTVKWRAEELSAIFMYCLISLQKNGVYNPCSIILFIIHGKDRTNSAIAYSAVRDAVRSGCVCHSSHAVFFKKTEFFILVLN